MYDTCLSHNELPNLEREGCTMTPFLFSFFTFCSTFLGGLFGIKHKDRLHLVISFTVGVLMGVTFFDIIPEMFSIASEYSLNITHGLVAIIVGFFVIHILEKAVLIHSVHEEMYEKHKHPFVGLVGASGLAFHSLLDGVGIGLGFHINVQMGILISLAVIAHDFCDGLNTVSIMLLHKNTLQKTFICLLVVAIAPVLGVLLTYFISLPDNALMIYLGFFAGFLLYIGASDLLPEAHSKHSSWLQIGLSLAGVMFIFTVTRFL